MCVYLGKGKTDWSAADAPPIYHSFRIYASFWCTLNLRGLQLHVCDEACCFSIVRLSDFDFLLDSDLRLFPPPLSFLGFLFHFIYRRTSISITILRVWLACSNCIKHLSLVPMKNQSIAFLKLSYSFFFFFSNPLSSPPKAGFQLLFADLSPGGSDGKESSCSAGDVGLISGSGRQPLKKGMTAHFNILAWRISWTEEPGGLIVHGVTKSWTWLSNYLFTVTGSINCPSMSFCLSE